MGAGGAQAASITISNVNVLNLLAPFLTLNATPAGRTTLQNNLDQAVAINNGASLLQQELAISDKNLLGGASNSVTTVSGAQKFGAAANLAGGLPDQPMPAGSSVTPHQPVGAYGSVLGPIYVNGVANGTAGPLGDVVSLLTTAYGNNSSDLGVAKNYFANGAASNPSQAMAGYVPSPAVAPPGYTLPTANGLPNTADSVYDLAYGVKSTDPGQDVYGDSRPVQVAPTRINGFDPTALSGLATNPSFPSGHTTYAYTDGILLGMLTPSLFQSSVLRASEYGNSRIVLGVHYPLDIIGGRALSGYDLAQALTNPLYNSSATTAAPANLPALFAAAQAQLSSYLSAQCGATVATCAASAANRAGDPYVPSQANQALYRERLTYGLPTLSFDRAPREAAPAGGPDASILLATVYGGDTAAARAISPNGGLAGTLTTGTINQVVVNTETNALSAFQGTPLSYWARLDLYAAAGYFGGTSGTLTMAAADRLAIPVTVGGGSTLYGNGATLAGTVTVANGGTFGGGSATAAAATTVGGNLVFQSGATYAVTAAGQSVSSTAVAGQATLTGANLLVSGSGTALPFTQTRVLSATGGVAGTFATVGTAGGNLNAFASYGGNGVTLTLDRTDVSFSVPGATANQSRVAAAVAAGAAKVTNATTGAFVNSLFLTGQASATAGAAALDRLGGEGIVASENAAFQSSAIITSSIADEQRAWRSPGAGAPLGVTLGSALPGGALGYAPASRLPFPPTKGPAAPPVPERVWRAWGGGFGGTSTIDGNAALGTARQSDDLFGGVVGLDYQARPDVLVGIAGGGSTADFRVPNRATTGTVTGGHGSVYASYGALNGFYAEGSVTLSGFANDVRRTAGGVGGVAAETQQAHFSSFEARIRGEVGQRFAYNGTGFNSVGVTPFAAVEWADLSNGAFTETLPGTNAQGTLSLAFADHSVNSLPVFAGLRLDGLFPVADTMLARPFVQVAYVHEFDPVRNLVGNFVSLPGASFLVAGARPAEDAAQVKTGLELGIRPGVSLFANFDGEFSDVQTAYAGKGGLRVSF